MNWPARISVGGTVPATGYLYIPRDEDPTFLDFAQRERAFTVTGCRTMGKSSLVNRWRPIFAGEGIRVIVLDVAAEIGPARDLEQWLARLRRALADFDQPGLVERFLERVPEPGNRPAEWLAGLLDALAIVGDASTLVVLDEFDSVSQLDFCPQLLSVWRAALHRDAPPGSKRAVRVCFLGLRPPSELAAPNSGSSSPWGRGIVLGDFQSNTETIDLLATALRTTTPSARAIAARILHHTGGQPLLTMLLASSANDAAVADIDALDECVNALLASERVHPTNLFAQIRDALLGDTRDAYAALTTWRSLLEGRRGPVLSVEAPGAGLLRSCGLLRSTRQGLEIKSPLFVRHFDLEWVNEALEHLAATQWTRPAPRSRPARRKRVCVFNTGGTIGMIREGDEIKPPKDADEFMRGFPDLDAIAEVQFVPLMNVDSVNVGPSDWTTIAREIYRRRADCDGFVVAHGTDTMAWSASAVALALGPHLDVPVVFTGAQTTPDVRHGDASINMIRACQVAVEKIPEVVVCFNDRVFRGVRVQKTSELNFNAFASPTYPPLATITEGIDVHRDRFRRLPSELGEIELCDEFASGVLMLQLTPGLEPELYRGALKLRDSNGKRVCRGIIIQTLGAGNVSSIKPFSMMPLIGDAVALGIPVVVSSPFPWDPGPARRYAPAKAPMEMGAISSGEMTAAAAAAKFRWAIALASGLPSAAHLARVREIMTHDYVGEGVGYVIDHPTTPEPTHDPIHQRPRYLHRRNHRLQAPRRRRSQ